MPAGKRLSKRPEYTIHREVVVRRSDSMPNVAKKVLTVQFRRMEASEKGTRKGEDIEKLHQMRVAVRRMRTAARIFGRFLEADEFEPFVREMRVLGRRLGPVRDLDVMLDHLRGFREAASFRERVDLDVVVDTWAKERAKGRGRILEHLDTPAYRRFKQDFPAFLEDDSAGVAPVVRKDGRVHPHMLSHEGPVILGERLAAVRAYEGWVEGDDVPLRRYHRLRIEVKRLRYALEFLSDAAGPEAEPLIASLKAVQDYLGEMREAWMTADRLERGFTPRKLADSRSPGHPGIAAYLASRQGRCQELRTGFPEIWSTIDNREVHRRITAIAASF